MVPIIQEAGWATGTVRTGTENIVPTVYAIPTYIKYFSINKIKSAYDWISTPTKTDRKFVYEYNCMG